MSSSANKLCLQCAGIKFNFFTERSLKDQENEKPPDILWTELHPEYCQFCQLLDHCRISSQDAQPSLKGTLGLRGAYIGHELQLFEDENGRGEKLNYSIRHCKSTPSYLNEKPQTSTKFDVEELKHWLEQCNFHKCLPGAHLHPPLPESFRLIDVQNNCIVRIRTHVEYCALSYVWGGYKQPWLTLDNALESKNSLDALGLPRTILDAMTLCRRLGCPYLWVDSLCIIQDSEDDKHRQILSMADIYSQSFLTIIATAGPDADAGLSPFGDLGRKCNLSYLVRSISEGTFVASLSPQIAAQEIIKSSWARRGWTLQEQALSRRVLFFTGSYTFLRCEKGLWCEDFNLGFSNCFEKDMKWDLPVPPFYRRRPNPGRHYSSTFSQMLAEFVHRDLSFKADILAAFTGILNRMKDSIGAHIWGLPTREFGAALQWTTNLPFPSDERPGFPSWSWAGWIHANKSDPPDGSFHDIYEGFDNLTTDISVVTCYIVGDDDDVVNVEKCNLERITSQLKKAEHRCQASNDRKEIARLEMKLRQHFTPQICPELQNYIDQHRLSMPPLSHHIFLWASCASLYVDQPTQATNYLKTRELPIRIKENSPPIGSILLNHEWRKKQPDDMIFFVSTVGVHSTSESSPHIQLKFKIILITPYHKSKPYRHINPPLYKRIQVSHTEICEADWSRADPESHFIALA